MFGNYETNCPTQICCTMGGMGFLLSTSGRVELFVGRTSARLTPTNDGFWNYCREIREFPSSELLCKKIARTFSKQHQTPAFPVIFHIASLNLFLFLFSMTLTLIAGSLQQKIHRDHGGDRNIVGFAEIISEINGQNPRQLLLPLLHGPQVPGNGHSMAGVLRV